MTSLVSCSFNIGLKCMLCFFQLRRDAVGAPDRRDALQGHRRPGHRVGRRHEQAHPAHPQHVPAAVEGPHGG